MATIIDIAKRAGVSRGTVDRVINHRGKVSPEKEAKILQAADELGYVPKSPQKSSGAALRPLNLLFCYADEKEAPFFTTAYNIAKQYVPSLANKQVQVHFHAWTRKNYSVDGTLLASASEDLFFSYGPVDGIICDGLSAQWIQQAYMQRNQQVPPMVLYNVDNENVDRLAFVGCDYNKVGRMAAGLAAMMTGEKGKVGIISCTETVIPSAGKRIQGFEQALAENYPEMEILFCKVYSVMQETLDYYLDVQQMLSDYPELNLIYLVNPADYSLCHATYRAGEKQKIKIITNDVVDASREMVRRGQISAVISQGVNAQAKVPFDILLDYLLYDQKPDTIWYETEPHVYFRENI